MDNEAQTKNSNVGKPQCTNETLSMLNNGSFHLQVMEVENQNMEAGKQGEFKPFQYFHLKQSQLKLQRHVAHYLVFQIWWFPPQLQLINLKR